MKIEPFSLSIGHLRFGGKSLGIIAFGLFIAGILTGAFAVVHINNANISPAISTMLIFAFAIPMVVLAKGFRKAENIREMKE